MATELTGGELFIEGPGTTVDAIVENIQEHQETLFEGQTETLKIDIPQVPFMLLVIFLIILFGLNKKVNL